MADTVEQNKAHFNRLAKEYDTKHSKTIDELIDHVRSLKDFIGVDWAAEEEGVEAQKPVRLLDYACGTGMITRALGSWVTSAVGIDITENMVDIYNTRADNQGLSESEMHAYQGDICSPPPVGAEPVVAEVATVDKKLQPSISSAAVVVDDMLSDAKFFNFDVAGVGLGFHHFVDPAYAAKRLAERLRKGGVLFVIEFLPHEVLGHGHAAAKTVTVHGFSEEQMRAVFEGAGCGTGFAIREMGQGGVVFEGMGKNEQGTKRRIFLARGTKS